MVQLLLKATRHKPSSSVKVDDAEPEHSYVHDEERDPKHGLSVKLPRKREPIHKVG